MSMKTYAAKHVLGMRGISMKPAEFNRVAAAAGVIVKAFRSSAKDPGKVKSYWRLGEAGERFAIAVENERSPEPSIQYLDDRFDELLAFMAPWLDAMQAEGEIPKITRNAEAGDAYRATLEAQQRERSGEAF